MKNFVLPAGHIPYNEYRLKGFYYWQKVTERTLEHSFVEIEGRTQFMLGGYSYHGFINHPDVKLAAIEAISRYGVGAYGTRIFVGTTAEHKALEAELAHLHRTEDAVLFPSGYNANVSTITALASTSDLVLIDKLTHASIVDGARYSGATVRIFRHNDIEDLEAKLRGRTTRGNVLVVIDAVYSMDGDVAPLTAISALCRQYGAALMVDECHSLLVLGEAGGGIEEQVGDWSLVDVKLGTLSKAIPGTGGYVAGSSALIDFLRHNGRSYIFSGATCPSGIAAARVALQIARKDAGYLKRLWENTAIFKSACRELGLNFGASETPISPIFVDTDELCGHLSRYCFENGVYVPAVLFPVVPRKKARLRATISSEMRPSDIRSAAKVISEGLSKLARECGPSSFVPEMT